MRSRASVFVGLVMILSACGRPSSSPVPAREQLTCGDSTMPRASYAHAAMATLADSLAGIAIVVEDSIHRRLRVADVQAWGPTGAIGGPGHPSGTTVFTDRDPGLYSLRLRLQANSSRWIYAATLRPRYLDTVVVSVGTRCTLVWHGT